MTVVNAAILAQARDGLEALVAWLADRESSADPMLQSARTHAESLAESLTGPRATTVVGQATGYLTVAGEYLPAISSARGTVERWASVATELAKTMQQVESRAFDLQSRRRPDGTTDADIAAELAWVRRQLDEIDVRWQRQCTAFAGELSGALAALGRCNAAVAVPVAGDDLLASVPAEAGPDAVAAWWSGLSPADQAALAATIPAELAALDGIPASVRDLLNRARATTRRTEPFMSASQPDLG